MDAHVEEASDNRPEDKEEHVQDGRRKQYDVGFNQLITRIDAKTTMAFSASEKRRGTSFSSFDVPLFTAVVHNGIHGAAGAALDRKGDFLPFPLSKVSAFA
jgi:hypothetical protein